MGPSRLRVSGAIWGRRVDDVRSTASTVVDGRGRAGRDKDGGGGVGHVFKLLIEDGCKVFGESGVGTMNTKQVLLEVVVVVVEDGVRGSQCEETMGGEDRLRVSTGVFILLVVQP